MGRAGGYSLSSHTPVNTSHKLRGKDWSVGASLFLESGAWLSLCYNNPWQILQAYLADPFLILLYLVKGAIHILRRNALKRPAIVLYSQPVGAVLWSPWDQRGPHQTEHLENFHLGCKKLLSLPISQLLTLEAKVRIHGQNIYWCNGWVLQGLPWGLLISPLKIAYL